ncbi:ribosome-associated heat shock protein Hsp15 [Sphingopyxis panaciterrae]|uniref:RNA-binding S4 domain-containing protein n=1 Tax=Sphingopyxis panaciterrae TaxID=363841 RepID=UPI00141E26E0|nr:RNA-binding S4 domain-containing protein [Sphingopyxis panaciterrae]NIJ37842.1 ribosome-associated heat shock protein Hsp15 [Sphingopyxis panaciterrae]
MASPGAAGSIRLDKLLWYLRFARSRSIAQAIVAAGHIRLDGRRVTRSSCAVHVGQTLVLPVGERIEVIRLLALPARRGPAGEAQACYRKLEPETPPAPISAISGNGKAVAPKGAGAPIE